MLCVFWTNVFVLPIFFGQRNLWDLVNGVYYILHSAWGLMTWIYTYAWPTHVLALFSWIFSGKNITNNEGITVAWLVILALLHVYTIVTFIYIDYMLHYWKLIDCMCTYMCVSVLEMVMTWRKTWCTFIYSIMCNYNFILFYF